MEKTHILIGELLGELAEDTENEIHLFE